MPAFEPLPTERAALIARIKQVSFTPTQIRERELPQVGFKGGYDIEEVDDFRALIAEAVQLLH